MPISNSVSPYTVRLPEGEARERVGDFFKRAVDIEPIQSEKRALAVVLATADLT